MNGNSKRLVIPCGIGELVVTEGMPGYGAVCVDVVVDGISYPIVVIESPTDKSVASPATDVDAVTTYVYGNCHSEEWTGKIKIPHAELLADRRALLDDLHEG